VTDTRADAVDLIDPPSALQRDLSVAGLVSMNAVWTALPGGRTNQVWRVEDESGRRVVKLYAKSGGTPLFRNDPKAEAMVLEAIKGRNLAPEPIFSGDLPSGAVLVYAHQRGSPWRSGVAPVAHLLRSLHDLPLHADLQPMPSASDDARSLMAQTLDILSQIPSHDAQPLRALQPDGVTFPSGPRRLLHGDPVPDNLICPAGEPEGMPVLIDWQCPAVGDPLHDIALFLSPAMQQVGRGQPLTPDERSAFLTAYNDPATEVRLAALQPILHWRMAAYCLWKLTRSAPDRAYEAAMRAEIAALQALSA
jgi:aminoglycoside phosphotransferase (APT) family kinase protein